MLACRIIPHVVLLSKLPGLCKTYLDCCSNRVCTTVLIATSMPLGRGERKPRQKTKSHHQSIFKDANFLTPCDDLTVELYLKVLNNSYSHTSCFYSRRLRPQTPQGSDDEGGKSTLAFPYSMSLLTGKEEPSSAFPAHLSSGSRADKQVVSDSHTIFLLRSTISLSDLFDRRVCDTV